MATRGMKMSLDIRKVAKKSCRENCLMLREREQYYLSLEMSRNNLTRTVCPSIRRMISAMFVLNWKSGAGEADCRPY